jgi:hypothetical protein
MVSCTVTEKGVRLGRYHDHLTAGLQIEDINGILAQGCTIPGARSPGRINFIQWRLIFVGRQYGAYLASRHHSGA